MNELVQLLMQKTGLSQEKAQQVVDAVMGHLKNKLPSSIASHLDSFLSGGEGQAGGLAEKAKSAVAGLGGMFGKKDE
jgi:uncharacterized protein (DUF2267 family)